MHDLYRRAYTWLLHVERSAADSHGVWRGGEWVLSPSVPRVHDANRVIVREHGNQLIYDEIVAAAHEIQQDLPQRVVEFEDPDRGAALLPEFHAAGWRSWDHLLMAWLRRAVCGEIDTSVREVSSESLRPARLASLLDEPWVRDESIATEVISHRDRTCDTLGATLLAIVDGGRPVSYCEVYDFGTAAQVEAVATLPEYRGRGLSRRVVSHALHLVRDRQLVYLVADPEDWPQHFYARLGFDPVGRIHRFLLAQT